MNDNIKKGRGLKIAVAVVSILLIISFSANMYFYSRHSGLESQVADLQRQVDRLERENANLQNRILDLEDEVNQLKAPKLVKRLSISDQRPWFQTPYFHISGFVVNVGTDTAYNC
ncbi:unnamed protein product, partial [marine sediment metagenome]